MDQHEGTQEENGNTGVSESSAGVGSMCMSVQALKRLENLKIDKLKQIRRPTPPGRSGGNKLPALSGKRRGKSSTFGFFDHCLFNLYTVKPKIIQTPDIILRGKLSKLWAIIPNNSSYSDYKFNLYKFGSKNYSDTLSWSCFAQLLILLMLILHTH